MFILAIAILVCEDLRRRVRLISPDPECHPDVTELRAHVVVEGTNSGLIVGSVFSQFRSFRTDFRARLYALFLQTVVPAADLLPIPETAHHNIGLRKTSTHLLPCQFCFFLLLFRFVLMLEIRTRPGVGAIGTGVAYSRLKIWALDFNGS